MLKSGSSYARASTYGSRKLGLVTGLGMAEVRDPDEGGRDQGAREASRIAGPADPLAMKDQVWGRPRWRHATTNLQGASSHGSMLTATSGKPRGFQGPPGRKGFGRCAGRRQHARTTSRPPLPLFTEADGVMMRRRTCKEPAYTAVCSPPPQVSLGCSKGRRAAKGS